MLHCMVLLREVIGDVCCSFRLLAASSLKTLWVHTWVMFPRSSLLIYVLRETFFPKGKLKFCRIIMAIRGDSCSKMQAWNLQLFSWRADYRFALQKLPSLPALFPSIPSVFALLSNIEVEFKDRTVCGFFLAHLQCLSMQSKCCIV